MSTKSKLVFFPGIAALAFLCTSPLAGEALNLLYVQPSSLTVTAGQNFSVDVKILNVTDLYAFQFDLGFNPAVLKADSVSEGTFLPFGGSTIFVPGSIDNVAGDVSDNADTLETAVFGVTGSGLLASFDFTALAPTSSPLDIFNVILLDSSLNNIGALEAEGSVTVTPSAVPEPRGSALLLCCSLLLIAVLRRRVRRLLSVLILPVLGMGQIFDTTPPTLAGVSFQGGVTSVNTTAGPQTLNVLLQATDNLSGVLGEKSFAGAFFTSPSGAQTAYYYGGPALAGSVALNATFQEPVLFPEFCEKGFWTLRIYLSDAVGNSVNYTSAMLASMGFPSGIQVNSNPDTTPPVLAGFALSTQAINVSNGPQPVRLTMHLTDSPAGVVYSAPPFITPVVFTGPSGQLLYEEQQNVQFLSGTSQNGSWSVTVNFPQYAQQGTWTISSLSFEDAAGNVGNLDTAQIQALGFPAAVQVSSTKSDGAPPVLTGLTISPTAIDTATGPVTLTLTLSATDLLSGLDFIAGQVSPNFNSTQINFVSPSGQQTQNIEPYGDPFVLNSGSSTLGTWVTQSVLPQFSEGGTWILQNLTLQDAALNLLQLNAAQLEALGPGVQTSFVVFNPSLTPDGTISPGPNPSTVDDTVFGSRASVTLPAGAVSSTTSVAIDVLNSSGSPLVPTPTGFATNPATFFTNIVLTPEPIFPLLAPGATLVLPLSSPMTPGTILQLFYINGLGSAVQVQSTNPPPTDVQGTVDASGLSATFPNVSHFSTFVGYLPNPGTVFGDVNEDGVVNCKDVAIIKADFGQKKGQTGYNPLADLNNDGVINILDLAIEARLLPKGMTCQ